jgi:hypothetical protein
MHGSVTWCTSEDGEDKIVFSHSLDHLDEQLLEATEDDFYNGYKKILVVNPGVSKHNVSVLNLYYYELLRMYSSELEKENATLFTAGFSMNDKHIKEITLRAAKANPTLRIFICCSQNTEEEMKPRMEIISHPNIQILTPESPSEEFTLDCFTQNILTATDQKDTNDEEQCE